MECLNQSSWTDLLGFADAADARVIVGLSMKTGHDLRSHRKLDWLRLRAQHVPVEQRQRMLQQMRHNSTCEDAGCRQRMLQHMRHNARAGEHPPPPVLDGPSDPAADGLPTRRVGGPVPFPWDPTEARHLLQWTQSRGLDRLIAGFELGNEQNTACAAAAHAIFRFAIRCAIFPTRAVLPSSPQVHGGAGGDQLRRAPQPDGRTVAGRVDAAAALRPRPPFIPRDEHRPRQDGAQVHGRLARRLRAPRRPHRRRHPPRVHRGRAHRRRCAQFWRNSAQFCLRFPPPTAGFTNASVLDTNAVVASAVNASVRRASATVAIVGGEIGPHNGGSPPCNHTSMRWAVFGDSLWCADAMGGRREALCRHVTPYLTPRIPRYSGTLTQWARRRPTDTIPSAARI